MNAVRIVGIGASAGGLEAIKLVLASTPADTGFAFVVLQHLAPSQTATLREALRQSTSLPISDIEDGTPIAPNHLFLVPPNVAVSVAGDAFVVKEMVDGTRVHRPIDGLFASLVAARGAHAVGVILSGTANDGTAGLRAMRDAGGATFVQDPATAQFDEMPRSAIAIGAATLVLAPDAIGVELGRLRSDGNPASGNAGAVQEILSLLRDATGVDLSNYKRPTIDRRIRRRMSEYALPSIEAYRAFLAAHPTEVTTLYEDLLIHVTEFFRDRDTLDQLVERVFPAIVDSLPSAEAIRIWVPGCSTGQEAYSIAILAHEYLESRGLHRQVQLFGTDLSARAIDAARHGEYPDGVEEQIGDARLARFFTRTNRGWRVNKTIRERCVFVQHDLTADPPFSKLDLISCRNVLIYFGPALQQGVIPMLHYALNQPGFLVIGRAESLGAFETLFSPITSGAPIYARQPVAVRSALSLAFGFRSRAPFALDAPRVRTAIDVQRDVDHVLLARYAPACVLVDGNAEILQFRGRTGAFLEPSPGQPTHNLLKMVRGRLGPEIRAALQRAQRADSAVRQDGVVLREDGRERTVDLTFVPIPGFVANERNVLVIFEEASAPASPAPIPIPPRAPGERDEHEALRQELQATRERLHTALAQNAMTVEELSVANEELQSMNEELSSMNEELQTAKEELQSTNEELETVNEELHRGNAQLHVLYDDLVNVLASVDIAIAIVDTDGLVRRFTPPARTLLNLLPTDLGRRITDLQPNVHIDNLGGMIAAAIASLEVQEAEVVDPSGHAYRMQVRPYRSAEDVVSGAVISFVDISVLRTSLDEARLARDYAAAIVETSPTALAVLDSELRVHSANREHELAFDVPNARAVGRSWFELGRGRWLGDSRDRLRERLGDGTRRFGDETVEYERDPGDVRTLEVAGRPIPQPHDQPPLVLVRIADVTERVRLEAEREAVARERDAFLNAVSHELRGPLNAITLWTSLLRRGDVDGVQRERGLATIEQSALAEVQLVDDLLELAVSRSEERTLAIHPEVIDPRGSVEGALDAVRADARAKGVELAASLGAELRVSIDPHRLRQMAWHLISNAVKFTPGGGRVTVSLVRRDAGVDLVVEDTGQGIRAEFLPHLFEPFHRADTSSTRRQQGLGIGLALVHHLAERQGCSVAVKSPGAGMGTTFTLTLPRPIT